MLELCELVVGDEAAESLTLTLTFQDRQRSRLRVALSSGEEAALLLPRGTVLRGGQRLRASDGRLVRVVAAPEEVSTARANAFEALARGAYHLGNRHVPVQVGAGFVRYLRDHVLDAMVAEHGLQVIHELAPFEPESGAYGRHTHGPGHHHHGHAHDDEGERALAHRVRNGLGLVDFDAVREEQA